MSTKKQVIVSFITRDNDYQRLQAQDAQTVAMREGLDVDVLFANNNAIEQVQQLFKYVHRPVETRPAAIVVESVSGEGLERVAKSAAQNGIGWVLVNRKVAYLEALRSSHPKLLVCGVGVDQQAVGRLQAQQFQALLPASGQILYVPGPSDTSVAQERLAGAREAEAAGLRLLVVEARWTSESAEKAVQGWLRLRTGGKVDLVGCQNDAMAEGARRAFLADADETVRREAASLPFTGCDGVAEGGRRLVDSGALAATVVTPSNGGLAVEIVGKFLRGQPAPASLLQQPTSYPSIEEIKRRRRAVV